MTTPLIPTNPYSRSLALKWLEDKVSEILGYNYNNLRVVFLVADANVVLTPTITDTFTIVETTIDGLTIPVDKTILLQGQTELKQNGIYKVISINPTTIQRSKDYIFEEQIKNSAIYVNQGLKYEGRIFTCQIPNGFIMEQDNIIFTLSQKTNVSTDSNGNVLQRNFVKEISFIETEGTTTNLNSSTAGILYFYGISPQDILLPNATLFNDGWQFYIINGSGANLIIRYNDNSIFETLKPNQKYLLTFVSSSSTNGSWILDGGYQKLINDPINNNILTTDTTGQAIDSGKRFNDNGTTVSDILSASSVLAKLSTLPAGSGSGANLYLSSEASIGAYQTLSRSVVLQTQSTATATVSQSNPKVLLKAFLTPALGLTKLESGLWAFNLYASSSVLQDKNNLSLSVYKYSLNSTETLLFEAENGDINSVEKTQITIENTAGDFILLSTDRLLVKIYANSNHNNDVIITLYYNNVDISSINTYTNSHIHTPILISHNQLKGLNEGDYQHFTEEEKIKATRYATISQDGLLNSTDFTTFNDKQNKIVSPTNNNIVLTDAVGQTKDSGKAFSTDETLSANSNDKIPTEQAIKTYVDNSVAGLLNDRGSWDASSNLFPTTGGSGANEEIMKGDLWYVSVAGALGGKAVSIGDNFRALDDNPLQDPLKWSILEANIGYVPENQDNKSTDNTLGGATPSSIKYPSQEATKYYIDNYYKAGTGLEKINDTFKISNTGITPANYTINGISFLTANAQGQITSIQNVAMQLKDMPDVVTDSYIADGSFLVYDNRGISPRTPAWVATEFSGDISVNKSGVASINTGVITGNKIANSTITASNIANSTITGTQIASNVALAGSPTTTTQTAGDNSTKIATTSYVDTGLNLKANLTPSPINGNILTTDALGNPIDSGKRFNDSGATNQDIWSSTKIITEINETYLSIPSLPNVDFATTTNDSLSGLSARDGYTPVNGKFCLATSQTDKSKNGIWITSSGAWIRAKYDIATNGYIAVASETLYSQLNIQNGVVNVSNGTTNKNVQYQITISNPNATFGNSDITTTPKNVLPSSDPFNRFVSSTIGNNTKNNGTIAFPFETISRALTGASFPCIITASGQTFDAPPTLTSGQSNLTIQGNDSKDLSGKSIINGQLTTSTGFTRFAISGFNIFSGSSSCVSFGDGDEGRHEFEDVYFTTTGTELLTFFTTLVNDVPVSNFKNWIHLKNVSSENSPLASLNLPNLTGTATITISGSRTALSLGTIGNGWVVIIMPDVGKGSVQIKGTISSSAVLADTRNGVKLMSSSYFLANQTALNTLRADTSALTNGFYIPQFDNPVATNGTYAKGDLFYKGTVGEAPVIPFVLRVALYEDLNSISVGTGQTSLTYIKTGSGAWGQPSGGSSSITLTGDVSGTGTGSVATTIGNNVVSNAKLSQVGANTYKGNNTGATANATDIATNTAFNQNFETSTANIKANGSVAVGSLNTIARADHIHPTDTTRLSITLTSANVFVGNVSNVATGVAISGEATLSNTGVITLNTLSITGKVLTNYSATAGTVSASDTILSAFNKIGSSLNTASGQIILGNASGIATATTLSGDATISNTGVLTIANNSVSNAKLSQMPANTIMGNNTGVSATPLNLTTTEIRALLGLATTDTPTFAGLIANSVRSAVGSALTLDSNSTGNVNIGTGANAKTITIGNNQAGTGIVNVIASNSAFSIFVAGSSIFKVDSTNGITTTVIVVDPNLYNSTTDVRLLKWDFLGRITYDLVSVPNSGTQGIVVASDGNLQGSSSDIRLKIILGEFSGSLDILEKINPKKFIWKADEKNENLTESEKAQVGFIAQELKDILPEAVPILGAFKDENGKIDIDNPKLGYRDTPLIALLVNCVKDLNKANQLLETKLQTLEDRIKQLETKLQTL